MKVTEYVCNRCGMKIDNNAIYTIVPEALDQDGESTKGLPDEISDELFDLLVDKHLCLGCLKKVLKFLGAPAVINPEFEKAVPRVIEKPENKKDTVNKYVATITEDELRDMIEKHGMTVKQVSEKANLEISGIYIKMKKWGIQLPSKKKHELEKLPEPLKAHAEKELKKSPGTKLLTEDAVKEVYFSGKNIPEVAELFGVSVEEMRRFMIKKRISKDSKEYEKYSQKAHGYQKDIE